MPGKSRIREQFYAFHEGNETVWRNIVERNGNWLYALSLRLLRDPDGAEEAVQECFLRAFRQRRQLKDFERLHGWLRRICIRICLRSRDKNGAVSLHEVEEFLVLGEGLSPDMRATTKEEMEKVVQGLSRLSARQRSCLILSVFEGLSMKEISESVGIKEGTVKRYIFEARRSLCEYLGIGARDDEK